MSILAQSDRPRDCTGRHHAIAAVGAAALLLGVAATGTVKDSPPPQREIVVEALPLTLPDPAADPVQAYWHETRFERGDTFAALLARLGVDGAETARLLEENGGSKPFRNLRPGMTVQAETSGLGQLLALRFLSGDATTELGFERDGVGFRALEQRAELARQVSLKSGEIQRSLFATADAIGLPDSITLQLAGVFSGDIDFHRDLRRGDRLRVVYEVAHYNGRPLEVGRVLAAELVVNRKTYRAVWFVDETGEGGYYAPNGQSLRKAFLRSPLEFSRVTSNISEFTLRFHPILNEWRAHQGVDYGAPSGARVRATADGTVESAGWQGSYGNAVVLRHDAATTTLYAHLRGFASGIKRGAWVDQGEVIGYVGATGMATGPHLHYEFRLNNQHRNPLTIATPAAEPVAPQRMAAFRAVADPLVLQLELLARARVATLE
jgi:murein DD-endopeptidase MepM/ murein hydrolase activator NlpD